MSNDLTRPDGALYDDRDRASVVDEVDDILGQVIDGRYEVVSRLGSGGMGFVWEARDVVRGQNVVLKTLRPELVNNEKTAERFLREAMASASIDHENVILVLGHGVTSSYGAYYVMERLVGMDLAAAMRKHGGPLPVELTLDLAEQVASALGAAHARGIIHRDLKPENIYLSEKDGREVVKVLDFGLARLLDAGNKLTETGAVIGTPRYMAPEQCQGEKADPRADVYSLALVMHEMLTARQPYREFGTYEILGKKMFEEMAPPSALDPPVILDPRLEALLMRCLSKAPEPRPADGAQMLEALVALREELRSGAPPVVAPSVRPPVGSERPPAPASVAPPPAPAPEVAKTMAMAHYAAPSSRPEMAAAAPASKRGVPAWAIAIATAVIVVGLGVGAFAGWMWLSQEPVEAAPRQAAPVAPAPPTPTPVVAPAARPAPIVRVTSEPRGAEVRAAGGRLLGETPLEVHIGDDLEDGASVELSMEGYASRVITVSGEVPTAHVMLHPTSEGDGP
ncbi:MAG: serine/threonine protein kinase [Sandaracinaceae bacterium]|nr:serine/threonine protein kinase [Sandaracinaceae bacterium]